MEKHARAAYTEEVRDEIFDLIGIPLTQTKDFEGFENFVYGIDDRVIRVTHNSHRTRHQLTAELEFLDWLASNGAPVSKPLSITADDRLLSVGAFHVCMFERGRGQALDRSQPYSAAVIRQWGRSIGTFHRLSASFKPVYKRQDWREDENHAFRKRIAGNETDVIEAGEQLLSELDALPQDNSVYGLIHSDAHAGNFVADNDGQLTFFDFDDSLYTWFGYDVGTILFGAVLQPWVSDSDRGRASAAEAFLGRFLEGYLEQNDIAGLMLEQMPRFIALREFSQYAVIHAHMNPENPEPGFPARFIKDYRRRFKDRKPFAEVDFARFG